MFLPREGPHTFRSVGGIARGLLIVTPGGLENYFDALHAATKTGWDSPRSGQSWPSTASAQREDEDRQAEHGGRQSQNDATCPFSVVLPSCGSPYLAESCASGSRPARSLTWPGRSGGLRCSAPAEKRNLSQIGHESQPHHQCASSGAYMRGQIIEGYNGVCSVIWLHRRRMTGLAQRAGCRAGYSPTMRSATRSGWSTWT